MSNRTIHGGRLPRLLDESSEAWYHVYNRVACDKKALPLSEKADSRETFIRFLKFYAKAYSCQVATYTIMGNHYHLILKMEPFKKLSPSELLEKAKLFYPNTHAQTAIWTDAHWEQFNKRIFNLSDFMRNVQQGFGRWFNKTHHRRGKFWADRFKSTLLYGEKSLLECMQYVDLNPLRAGLVTKPEDYKHSAFFDRTKGDEKSLIKISSLLTGYSEKKSFEEYRSVVYMRAGIPSKEKGAILNSKLLDKEFARNFNIGRQEENRDHFRFYVDGLVLGTQECVLEWIDKLKKLGLYKRKKNPKLIKEDVDWFSFREQRSHCLC